VRQLIFSTGNIQKFENGRAACLQAGIELLQQKLDIDEIQGEDSEVIIRDKAKKAFEILRQPVVVSDDSWHIPGLKGFPGPYMKSMNHWFTPDDFLHLTRSLKDRRIILVQLLAYYDESQQKVFRQEYTGELLKEARGNHNITSQAIITMPGDNGLSIAEVYDRDVNHAAREVSAGWHELIKWYQAL